MKERPKKRNNREDGPPKFLIVIGRILIATIGFSVLLVLCLRWLPPPTSAFMVERYFTGMFQGEKKLGIRYRWVDWKSISPHVILAVVAAEDQKFMRHMGFDFKSISDAVAKKKKKGRRLRGASTITQQVAKNLFLWPGRSYLRKGIEAYVTVLLELLWSKKRILEVYLNIVEFGDSVYGVHAAAENLLAKSSAKQLTRKEAALLAAVLPNPRRLKVNNPSPYVRKRSLWIEKQMDRLAGIRELNPIVFLPEKQNSANQLFHDILDESAAVCNNFWAAAPSRRQTQQVSIRN